jgi:hypothetical protein
MSIESVLGEKVYRSVVVVMTMADVFNPNVVPKRIATVEGICNEKGLPCILWTNNSPDFSPISSLQLTTQVSALRNVLPRLHRYEMMDMAEYDRLVEHHAQEMMANDSSNRFGETKHVLSKRALSYTGTEPVMVSKVQKAYTEEEVKAKALEAREKAENKLSEVSFSTQFVDYTEYDLITETQTVTETTERLGGLYSTSCNKTIINQRPVPRTVQRQVQVPEVKLVCQPVEVFEKALGEQETVVREEQQREVLKARLEEELVKVTLTANKRGLDHYKKAAGKVLAREKMSNRQETA